MQVIPKSTRIKCDTICGNGERCKNYGVVKDNTRHFCGLHVPIPGEELPESVITKCELNSHACGFKARVLFNGKRMCCVHAKSEFLKQFPIPKKGPVIGQATVSDEELARMLQAEFDREQSNSPERIAETRITEQSLNEFDLKTQKIKITNVNTNCSICQDSFSHGQEARMLPCCHIFHLECIDPWLARSSSCPMCREEI